MGKAVTFAGLSPALKRAWGMPARVARRLEPYAAEALSHNLPVMASGVYATWSACVNYAGDEFDFGMLPTVADWAAYLDRRRAALTAAEASLPPGDLNPAAGLLFCLEITPTEPARALAAASTYFYGNDEAYADEVAAGLEVDASYL